MRKKGKNILERVFHKKTKFEKFIDPNEEFIQYCIVSLLCTIILYVVFFIVDRLTNGNYILANLFSYVLSFTLLYYLDQAIFKARPKRKRERLAQLIAFIAIRVIGFPIDSFVLALLINNSNLSNMAAKVVGSLIMFIYNYITNKLFVFRRID